MKNKRNIVIAAILGVFAVVAHQLYLNSKIESIVGPYEKLPVIVATTQILLNTRIEATMVSVQEVPKKFVQPGTIQKIEDVVGKLASVTIDEGEQILKNKLMKFDDAYLALRVPPGKRAVTIPVNDVTGVSGLVRPGNAIDVLEVFDYSNGQKLDKRVRTLFQNVLVLAVGQDFKFINDPLGLAKRDKAESATGVAYVKNITVALTPRQSQLLTLGREVGLLSVTLRPHFGEPGDVDLPDSDDVAAITNVREIIKPVNKAPYLEIRGGRFNDGY